MSQADVERRLELDPCGVYAVMDARTRARYRTRISRWAERVGLPETEIAERALERARLAASDPEAPPAASHVGYHLEGPGARGFEKSLRRRLLGPLPAAAHPLGSYLAALTLLSAVEAGALLAYADARGTSAFVLLFLAVVLVPLAAGHARILVTFVLRWRYPPRALPRMALREGIPDEYRTLLVVPAIFSSPENARAQVLRLATLARGQRDRNVYLALASDFPDADHRETPQDAAILAAAREAFQELRALPTDGPPREYFVLHRERRWSPTSGSWIGWERKRGKLEELNRLLCTPGAETTFRWVLGNRERLTGGAVRYLLTLDDDSWIEPGGVTALVAAAAHPLNRPYFDPRRGRITEGYGIIQPQVMQVHRRERSRWSNLLLGRDRSLPALSPKPLVWNLYYDVFDDGRYEGKALLDVLAYRRVLEGTLPPEALVLHDQLEGLYMRVGYMSDVYVVEHGPSNLLARMTQAHRWCRGYCQHLPWLRGQVRDQSGKLRRNPLGAASRLRIAGKLQQYFFLPSGLVLLLLAITLLPGSRALWAPVALGAFLLDLALLVAHFLNNQRVLLSAVVVRRVRRLPAIPFRRLQGGLCARLGERLAWAVTCFACLPCETWVVTDACARAAWRMLVSRRRLLHWTAQHEVERNGSRTPLAYFCRMWPSTACGVLTLGVALLAPGTQSSWLLALCGGVWSGAFLLAWYLGRPAGSGAPSAEPAAPISPARAVPC